jgi:formyltetrahydrofolate synthetase
MVILAKISSLGDLHERLGRMVAASSRDRIPITAHDLGEALAVLMIDASILIIFINESNSNIYSVIKPTIMQTLEGTPILIHARSFANIAHESSSILTDQIGFKFVRPKGYIGMWRESYCERCIEK